MTELKTTEDLFHWNNHYGKEVIFREDLRAEAIKWVKSFYPLNKRGQTLSRGDFMKFHNITGDDLK